MGLPMGYIENYITRIRRILRQDSFPYKCFIIPTNTGEMKIECINPQRISNDEYKKVELILDECKTKLDEFLNKNKIDSFHLSANPPLKNQNKFYKRLTTFLYKKIFFRK